MKKICILICMVLCLSGCGTKKEEPKEVSCEQIKEQTDAILLDVRSKIEYDTYHLPNAKHLDVRSLEENVEKELKDKNAKIVVYCQSGSRSKTAMEILKRLGYQNIQNLSGGIASCS